LKIELFDMKYFPNAMFNNEEYYISFLCTYLHCGVLDVVLYYKLWYKVCPLNKEPVVVVIVW